MIRKKIKVAAYARVSTDKDDQLNSLDNQRIYFQNYIKGHPDWEFVDVYWYISFDMAHLKHITIIKF